MNNTSAPKPFISKLLLFPLLAAVFWSGCKLPNIGSFADTTANLSQSVKLGGGLAIDNLKDEEKAKALRDSWQHRQQTMDAMVRYSGALVAISEASAKSRQNAAQVVGAVKDLAGAIPYPGISTGVSKAGDLLVFVGQNIIEIKAYHDMGQAIESAHPFIAQVGEALQKDFEQLRIQFNSSMLAAKSALQDKYETDERYYNGLFQRRAQLRGAFKVADGDLEKAEKVAELEKIGRLIQEVEPQILTYRNQLEQLEAKKKLGDSFFQEARSAIHSWTATHEDLYVAFKENRRPDLVLLASKAEELKGIINRLQSSPN
jgi:hypothetical protein